MNVQPSRINPYRSGEGYLHQQKPSSSSGMEEGKVNREGGKARSILTDAERITLQSLFGSERPGEVSFYGPGTVQLADKGQFLDVKG